MRRLAVLIATMVIALGLMAGPAFAFHCYVENKPNGAGAATLDDIKPAGKSGKLVFPGAFINLTEFGAPVDQDVFVRGQPVGEEEIVGIGSLPEQPHHRGGDNGVQSLPPPDEPPLD